MSSVKSGASATLALILSYALVVFVVMGAPDVQAQTLAPEGPAPTIQNISVSGNQRIEAETVASYLTIQPGMPAQQQLLDLQLKTLFNTGLFSDVTLDMEPGGLLMISVKENPIVNRVILDGNKRVKDDKITGEVQLTARGVFTRAKVQSDVSRIIEVYRRTGRFAATVTPKITLLEQNRVDVIYEIDEGPKTGVAKINFVGNTVFSSSELRGAVVTDESRWWKMFSSNSNFDPDRMEYDRDLLRQHYGKHGYADFQVVSAVAELTPDRKDFFITFTVDEGPKYTIGDVKVKTTLEKLDEEVLERFVPIKTGDVFNGEKMEKVVESITFATGATGYAFVDVNPRMDRNIEGRTIDLTFEVNEGPRVYVDRINIKGNTRTLDKVIRREVRLAEGDAFNRVLVDRSKARLRSLGFFQEVEIEEKPGSAPDRTELDVTVQEQATGSFSIGVGVSNTESFILDFSVEQRNLMGRGQFLRFRVQASSRTRSVDIRFTQPYLFDRNMTGGFSIFNQRTNFRETGFVRNRTGFGLNTGFQVSEYGRMGINYQLTYDDVELTRDNFFNRLDELIPITDDPASLFIPGAPTDDANVFVTTNADNPLIPVDSQNVNGFICDFIAAALTPQCESQGQFLTSLLGYSLGFDTRDDPIDPKRGWRASISQGVAGLGGDVKYHRSQGDAAIYQNLFGGFVGALKIRAGFIDGFGGDSIRLSDRFFEGASTFRGFEVAGIGPRFFSRNSGLSADGTPFGQAIGAKVYAVGSAELRLPLPLPKEYGIRASLFSDFGSVGLVDDETKLLNEDLAFWVDPDGDGIFVKPVQDDLSLRVSAGVSVSWDSPFGPVRFDFAEVFMKEEYDRTEGFRFSAGTSF